MSKLGRYEVRDRLGRGGFATVFRGWDPLLKREVAVKALSVDWSEDEDVRRRFVQEAQALASLRHEHIVTVYDVGETQDRPFFVMELLDGGSLDTRLAAGGRMDLPEVARIATAIAGALDTLHAAQMIHRDVKPGNIMLTNSSRVVLMDLGIARVLDTPGFTSRSVVMLSPEAASPEQIRGQVVGPPTDIYSLGVVVYQMLAGRPPFVGETAELLHKHVYEPPPPLWEMRPGLPPLVYAVVDEALAKDPARRPRTAEMLAAALRAAIEAPPAAPVRAPAPASVTAATTVPAWPQPQPRAGAAPPPPQPGPASSVPRPAAAVETAWARPQPNGLGPQPLPPRPPAAPAPTPSPSATAVAPPGAVPGNAPLVAAAILWVLGVVAVFWALETGRLDNSPLPLLVLAPGPFLFGMALPLARARQLAVPVGGAIVLAALAGAAATLASGFGDPDGTLLVVVLIVVVPAIAGTAAAVLTRGPALAAGAAGLALGMYLWMGALTQHRPDEQAWYEVTAFVLAQAPLVGLPLTRLPDNRARAGMALVLPWLTLLVVLVPVLIAVE